jgi:hypothetical protein
MRRTQQTAPPNSTELPATVTGRPGPRIGWPERACCCPAQPVVKALLPTLLDGHVHIVDLYLCGHHYRQSFSTLVASRATTINRPGMPAFW